MLEIRLLKTFLAVAADCSFRKAAEALHLAPSTVTAQVKSLEDDLGFPVFDRIGRRVLLTEQGSRLLAHARRLVDMEAETRRVLGSGGDECGELSVRISESLGVRCMPDVLGRFRQRFPETRLHISTASRLGLARDLRHGSTDLGLLLSEPFSAAGLHVEILGRERLAVIAPPGSPLAGLARVRPADLEGTSLFLTRHVWSARRLIEEALLEAQVRSAPVVDCSSVEMVKRCVMAGLGVSVVPAFAVREEAARGALVMLDWAGGPLSAPVMLVRHEERWVSPAARGFMDAVRAYFGAAKSGVREDGSA